jgi:3-hydroxymyristoyl/3-hydroxydecanoyl-(acyl carrier protein) dehydratase
MNAPVTNRSSEKILQNLLTASRRDAALHRDYLLQRRTGLEHIHALLVQQIEAAYPAAGDPLSTPAPASLPVSHPTLGQRRSLFTRQDLEEFASGSIARCLGEDFRVFDLRRSPRIPNGDLLLMSRVLELEGQPYQLDRPAHIQAEVDVPMDAWYVQPDSTPDAPYSVLMEMALQPCGFLSAALRTPLVYPELDLYFRNLDGNGTVLFPVRLAGNTIQSSAQLVSTATTAGTIIQSFTFQLALEGKTFFQGSAVFGYFRLDALNNQNGLDGGPASRVPTVPETLLPISNWQLPGRSYLDQVSIQPGQESDYVYAQKRNHPGQWFYTCHFFEDPVMPGSLGIEALFQVLRIYAAQQGLLQPFHRPHYHLALNSPLAWKYRGQITPANRLIQLEATVRHTTGAQGEVPLLANASLWVDQKRIYHIENAALQITEGFER